MTRSKKMHIITNAYSKLHEVDSDKDLRKLNLSLSDYHTACDCMMQLGTPTSSTETICENVADFFRWCGFTVSPKGIGFLIYLK